MSVRGALDTTIAVVTPENIAFEYQLAGPFRRLPAYLIDWLARWVIILLLVILIWFLGALIDIGSLSSWMLAATFLIYFVLSNFYGTLMEMYFNGRTIGKWACGLRVVGVDGSPIDGRAAFLRNLLRVADLAPYVALNQIFEGAAPVPVLPTGMIGLVCMIMTPRLQRLGDLAAGTIVVVDERHWQPPAWKLEDPRIAALSSFIPADYRVTRGMARTLAIYVERRQYLTPTRRREIAKRLAVPLMDRFSFRDDVDPDLLMVALYHHTFVAKAGEEVDLGPLAGFSPLIRDNPQAITAAMVVQA